MNILIANQLEGVQGGRETYLREVIRLLRSAGHDLGFAFEEPAAVGTPSVVGDDPGRVWYLPADAPKMAAWRPDLVYLHGLSDPGIEAAAADTYPTVYFPHGYYGTCVSGSKCHSRPGYEPCRRTLGLGCLAAYLPRGCGGWNPLTALRLYRTQRRRQANLRRYRGVLVASRHMADEYRRHGVEEGRLRVVPLFPTDVVPDPEPPIPRPPTGRVLFVGRLTELKGLRHLVAAVSITAAELGRTFTLVVAGDGPDRAAAESAARAAGVPTEFLGWVEPSRRTAEMRAAEVLAVPSLWPEPFGLVGVEAGCVGLPAVGYATGGIPDWLIPGVSGESAPGDRPNSVELAAALVRALANDAHRHRLGVGAWETARGFTPAAHIRGLTDVFEEFAPASKRVLSR